MLICSSLALRLTFADRFFLLKWNFYLPAVPMITTGVVLALMARAKWVVRVAIMMTVLVLGGLAFLQEQPIQRRLNPPDDPIDHAPGTFTVMSYNVMAYAISEKGILETIHDADPDVLCLVEGTFGTWAPTAVERKLGKSYHWCIGNRLSIASRLPIVESQQIATDSDSMLFRVVVKAAGEDVAVYVVDVDPPGRRRDSTAFAALGNALGTELLPAIIVGDFNVPRGSYHLNAALEGWNDAFLEAATTYYVATWPSLPVPLWQIDHAFTRSEVVVHAATVIDSTGSDHLPIMLTCTVGAAIREER